MFIKKYIYIYVCNKKDNFHKNRMYVINTELRIRYFLKLFLFIALVYFA